LAAEEDSIAAHRLFLASAAKSSDASFILTRLARATLAKKLAKIKPWSARLEAKAS
jgi:hypothetical protein